MLVLPPLPDASYCTVYLFIILIYIIVKLNVPLLVSPQLPVQVISLTV